MDNIYNYIIVTLFIGIFSGVSGFPFVTRYERQFVGPGGVVDAIPHQYCGGDISHFTSLQSSLHPCVSVSFSLPLFLPPLCRFPLPQ